MHFPYDPSTRGDHVRRYLFALQWITNKVKPDAHILDAACGIGYGCDILRQGAANVVGVDRDRETIAYARKHWKTERTKYVLGDILEAAGDFDAVVSFETLEHVDNAPEVVRHFAKQASWLIASVPNETLQPFSNTGHPEHKRHYTPEQFTGLFEDNGFAVTRRLCQTTKGKEPPQSGTNGRTLIYIGARKQT